MLSLEISNLMLIQGYQWRNKEGDLFFPEPEQVQEVLDKMVTALYDDGMQIEVGGIIMIRTGDHYDVFVRQGSMTPESKETND